MNAIRLVISSLVVTKILIAGLLCAPQALAEPNDDFHLIANGAGISTPSSVDAINDNPAGLVFNTRLKLLGAAAADRLSFDPFSAIGRAAFGNGSTAGLVGLHSYKQGSDNRTAIDYGVGALAEPLQTSFGLGGTSLFNNTNGSGDTHHLNFGSMVHFSPTARAGMALYGILGGIDYIGSGFSTLMSDNWWFSLDGAWTPKFEGKTFKAALGYMSGEFQLTLGYAVRFDTDAPSFIREGFGAGAAVRLGKEFYVEATYNHHSKYLIGIIAYL